MLALGTVNGVEGPRPLGGGAALPINRPAVMSTVFLLAVAVVLLVRLLPAGDRGFGLSLFGNEGDVADQVPDTVADRVDLPASNLPSPDETPNEAPDPDLGSDPVAYAKNLSLILASGVRNTNHDQSPYLSVPSDELVIEDHLGPRADYLTEPGGNTEISFPTAAGGQFRAGCEFSHFAYDDPLVAPFRPGASHLHMFFGNTHVNAYSTYETVIDSGSSTCNGQELNRTAYWVPAMFDGEGNVRVPERVVVYYKGEGLSRGASVPYPPGAALIATENINERGVDIGGAQGKYSFVCSDQWSGASQPAANTIPNCDGDVFFERYGVTDRPHVVLEMNVKFSQCWNGEDPSAWSENFAVPAVGGWYASICDGEFDTNLPNLEYFVNYRVDIGESTKDWYLASDVDRVSSTRSGPGGVTVHGDWWGGWNTEVSQMWIDNCVNYQADPVSGCGFGYLSDGGPDPFAPFDGPALRYRPQYTGPYKISAATIFEELCAPLTNREFVRPEDAAYCLVD